MATPDTIASAQLSRLIGTPDSPVILDVRIDQDVAADPRIMPGSVRRDFRNIRDWAGDFAGRSVVVTCQRGQKLSQGVAAWLRNADARAENLEGGHEAWIAAKGLLVSPDHVPPRDAQGRTLWVTRARPKIDRIACPWLIRRFVDRSAVFLFVAPSEVADVADRGSGDPFQTRQFLYRSIFDFD